MALYEAQARPTSPNVVVGFAMTLAVHAALTAAAVWLHKEAPTDTEPLFKNVVEAKLVRLGQELPKDKLPELVAAQAPPPPDPGPKITTNESTTPEPPKPKPKPKPRPPRRDAEKDLAAALNLASASTQATSRKGAPGGKGEYGGSSTGIGHPQGDVDGEVTSVKDQIEGNLWAAKVRNELFKVWSIPTVISDAELQKLSVTVVIQIDAQGNIRGKPRFRARTGKNDLFEGSVNMVFSRINQLPPPPPGALKIFKNGWVALRFKKSEADKVR